ncbi:hypothetical protein KY308_01490 [Candidatus Woesearchaeota archaeon]|nr:hypothetical protein [Candidatus Woesearchaeota archaeon]
MGEKFPLTGARVVDTLSIKYEDVFNFKELYKIVRDWLIAYDYASDKQDEKMERFYLEKINAAGGKEIWVWWRTSKTPHGSKYFRYFINVDFHVLNMKDVEIMHQGTKIKANKGEVEVMINCYLETEAEFQVEKSMLGYFLPWNWFAAIFKKRIYREKITEHKKDLLEELNLLQHEIKTFLELKSFLPKSEMLHPARGL